MTDNRFQLNSAAFKIDGYIFPDSRVEATVDKERARQIAFDLAKEEIKSHILAELKIIEEMELEVYDRCKKRDFRV